MKLTEFKYVRRFTTGKDFEFEEITLNIVPAEGEKVEDILKTLRNKLEGAPASQTLPAERAAPGQFVASGSPSGGYRNHAPGPDLGNEIVTFGSKKVKGQKFKDVDIFELDKTVQYFRENADGPIKGKMKEFLDKAETYLKTREKR